MRALFFAGAPAAAVLALYLAFSAPPHAFSAPPESVLANLLEQLAKLLLYVAGGFAISLFFARLREREISWPRAFVLVAAMSLTGAARFALDNNLLAARTDILGEGITRTVLAAIAGAGIYALGGLFLAAAYTATESRLREGYPGKLLSLDALFAGRFDSRTAGLAVSTGAAVAAWLALVALAVFRLSGAWPGMLSAALVDVAKSRLPALAHLLAIPLTVVWGAVAGLLIPLAWLHNRPRYRRFTPYILAAVALLVSFGLNHSWTYGPAPAFALLLWTAALLLGYHFSGFAAAFAAAATYQLLVESAGFTASGTFPAGALIAFLSLLPFAWFAWRGHDVDAADVTPGYSQLQQQRLQLRAQAEGAREAQLHLLPKQLPQLPGLALAANCYPAGVVGGDFYDFFPLPAGRLAILLASGSGPGLPSALTIALAKGFLACDLPHSDAPAASLARFRAAFPTLPGGIALLFFDPASRIVQAARLGDYPAAWILRARAWHPLSFEVPSALLTGDELLLYSRGLVELLDDRSHSGQAQLLARAIVRPHADASQALLAQLRGRRKSGPPPRLASDLTLLSARIGAQS